MDTSIKIVLEISFDLLLNNIDIKFIKIEELTLKTYAIIEVLPNI